MAEYFGTSLDYLVLGKGSPTPNVKNELLEMARAITELAGKI